MSAPNLAGLKFKAHFLSPYEQYRDRNGQAFVVLSWEDHKTHPDKYDPEVGHLYIIRFPDGMEITAWPEEVEDQA